MSGGYYEPGDPGPVPDAAPMCPICPADHPHRVIDLTGMPDAFLCDGCGTVLTPHVGGDNRRRRDLWAEATQPKEQGG